MKKIFKIYTISICCAILGQILSLSTPGVNYIAAPILSFILIFTSSNLNLMKNKDFLFAQLILISTFLLENIITAVTLIKLISSCDNITYSMSPWLCYASRILQLIGYISTIICLLKFKNYKDKM